MAVVLVLNAERHAAAMTRWSVHFARSLSVPLHIILPKGNSKDYVSASPTEQAENVNHWTAIKAALLDLGLTANRTTNDEATTSEIRVFTREVAATSRTRACLTYIDEANASLLVVGKQLSARSDHAKAGQLAHELFDVAPCPTLLLRLGNHEGAACRSLLVPTRDGEHSATSMRLGHAVARHCAAAMNTIIVEPRVGADAHALGEAVLKRALHHAKIDENDPLVTAKVLLANDIPKAIAQEAEANDIDLLLLGATDSKGLRKRLFGTVPDKLLRRPDGMAIGVIRGALPAGQALRGRFDRWWDAHLPPLDRQARTDLFEQLQNGSVLRLDFVVLISLSTLLAGLGLVQGSAAVVIGAMLVAPLMTPLLGSGLGLVQGNVPMLRSCALSIFVGFLIALTIGYLTGVSTLPLEGGMTDELRGRTAPTLIDLGVAFVSGIAASYCLARPNLSSALAGVAIAAALVPPIATSGIAMSHGTLLQSGMAALLFTTNVVAIILGAAFTFFLLGIRGISESSAIWGRRLTLMLLIAFVILSIILSKAFVT